MKRNVAMRDPKNHDGIAQLRRYTNVMSAPPKEATYIGAFGDEKNWLDEWTVSGHETHYDTREAGDEGE